MLRDGLTFRTVIDSGAPVGSSDYTTVVLAHGLMWSSDVFERLAIHAPAHNARVIAFNRREYPGSELYTDAERAVLERVCNASAESKDAAADAQDFARDRAREVYDYLAELVIREDIPLASSSGNGGIVFVGWSFGTLWATAFLAHAPNFEPVEGVDLSAYVRRVVAYDGISAFFGHDTPADAYNPLFDETYDLEERIEQFNEWVAAYWEHGPEPGIATCAARAGLEEPQSTLTRFSEEQLSRCTYRPPGKIDGGSDMMTIAMCTVHGVFGQLKDGTFYRNYGGDARRNWDEVEVRIVWCEKSIWLSAWVWATTIAELDEAKASGKETRNINLVRLRGANHFAHWDFPEKTLLAFLESTTRLAESSESYGVDQK